MFYNNAPLECSSRHVCYACIINKNIFYTISRCNIDEELILGVGGEGSYNVSRVDIYSYIKNETTLYKLFGLDFFDITILLSILGGLTGIVSDPRANIS